VETNGYPDLDVQSIGQAQGLQMEMHVIVCYPSNVMSARAFCATSTAGRASRMFDVGPLVKGGARAYKEVR